MTAMTLLDDSRNWVIFEDKKYTWNISVSNLCYSEPVPGVACPWTTWWGHTIGGAQCYIKHGSKAVPLIVSQIGDDCISREWLASFLGALLSLSLCGFFAYWFMISGRPCFPLAGPETNSLLSDSGSSSLDDSLLLGKASSSGSPFLSSSFLMQDGQPVGIHFTCPLEVPHPMCNWVPLHLHWKSTCHRP